MTKYRFAYARAPERLRRDWHRATVAPARALSDYGNVPQPDRARRGRGRSAIMRARRFAFCVRHSVRAHRRTAYLCPLFAARHRRGADRWVEHQPGDDGKSGFLALARCDADAGRPSPDHRIADAALGPLVLAD